MRERVVYYKDELADDFAGVDITPKPLPQNYKYVRKNLLYRAVSFIAYRLIATPVAFLTCKLYYGIKYKNRKALKGCKEGCFLYINHTMTAGDAFNPNILAFPRKTHVIVGDEAVSNCLLRTVVPMLGGIPLPTDRQSTKGFKNAIEQFIADGNCITIYPEAHIWLYYTGIRPFKDVAFRYPAELNAPAFAVTVVYKKRRFANRPRADVYVDGPFYPNENLSVRENRKKLRDEVYTAMTARAKESDCEYIKYVKQP